MWWSAYPYVTRGRLQLNKGRLGNLLIEKLQGENRRGEFLPPPILKDDPVIWVELMKNMGEENVHQALDLGAERLKDNAFDNGVVLSKTPFSQEDNTYKICKSWVEKINKQEQNERPRGEARWTSERARCYSGCEADVVIIVASFEEIDMEILTRAKRQLIIIADLSSKKRKMIESARNENNESIFSVISMQKDKYSDVKP